MAYPGGAADDIRELMDELDGAGDDFVGLLLSGVSETKMQKKKRHIYPERLLEHFITSDRNVNLFK